MKDDDCVRFLQWLLPQLQMRWPGFRKVRRQVCRRVDRRLVQLGIPDLTAYQQWIETHPDELPVLDAFCRITISRFYRDRGVFDCLRDVVLPALAREAAAKGRREVRCWNAGCASGEEPYTIGIIWQKAVAPNMPQLKLRVIATDSDRGMLERAARGCYPRSSLKDLPSEWMATCFEALGDEYSIRPEYRSGIEWHRQDIREDMPNGPFDLVFCRHLAFTYFNETLQERILDRIVSRLRPSGILVTGKQEPLPVATDELAEIRPHTGIYRKPDQ